eukprot:2337459-Pyramimonas_sp.AAC.1
MANSSRGGALGDRGRGKQGGPGGGRDDTPERRTSRYNAATGLAGPEGGPRAPGERFDGGRSCGRVDGRG